MSGSSTYGPWPMAGAGTVKLDSALRMRLSAGPSLLAGLTWPSINSLLSQQIPPNAQGELQGGLTSLGSLAAIVSPPVMTQLLALSSTPSFYFPGAPFVLSAILVLTALLLLRKAASKLVMG